MSSTEIKIREVHEDDLSGLHELLNDLQNQKLVGGSLKGMSHSQVLDWLNNKRADDKTFIFSIIRRDEFVGYFLITSIDKVNGHAVFGINILRSAQGKGIGPVAMTLAHEFCKETLLIKKLILHVKADNHFAISLYNKMGYKLVDKSTDYAKDGKAYLDKNIMEVLL
jgi:RimJ/RimL family protein N-acetyltransferase|tara:strand:- start:111 stop:611 length:501 start_codon:yes stop_codon:yes gene_type:complete